MSRGQHGAVAVIIPYEQIREGIHATLWIPSLLDFV